MKLLIAILLTASAAAIAWGAPSTMSDHLNAARQLENKGVVDAAAILPGKGNAFDTLMIGVDSGIMIFVQRANASNGSTGLVFFAFLPCDNRNEGLERLVGNEFLVKAHGKYEMIEWRADSNVYSVTGFANLPGSADEASRQVNTIVKDALRLLEMLKDEGIEIERRGPQSAPN